MALFSQGPYACDRLVLVSVEHEDPHGPTSCGEGAFKKGAAIAWCRTSSNCRAMFDQSYSAARAAAVRSYLRRSGTSPSGERMLPPKFHGLSSRMQSSPL